MVFARKTIEFRFTLNKTKSHSLCFKTFLVLGIIDFELAVRNCMF